MNAPGVHFCWLIAVALSAPALPAHVGSDGAPVYRIQFSSFDQTTRIAIETAIAQLPETQRMAVVLRRYDELSYEQIAEVLNQSVPAVKSLLFRARTELRVRLGRYLAN